MRKLIMGSMGAAIRMAVVVSIVFGALLVFARQGLPQGKLVLVATQHLDESIDEEFEVTGATWITEDTLSLLTADGSVFLLDRDRIIKSFPSHQSSFNANGFAVSRDIHAIAVATSTGLATFDVVQNSAIPNGLRGPWLAVGLRGDLVVAVGPLEISTLRKEAGHYSRVHDYRISKPYAAAVFEDGSRIVTIDTRRNLSLYDVNNKGSVGRVCEARDLNFSGRIATVNSEVLAPVSDGGSTRVVSVDSNCRVSTVLTIPSRRIVGISATSSFVLVRTSEAIGLWSRREKRQVATLASPSTIGPATLSPDGRTVVLIARGSTVEFWRIEE
jgi:WD40 repeat protein